MKEWLLSILCCPTCLPVETRLQCEGTIHVEDCDILKGGLACPRCGTTYPIIDGTAHLVTPASSRTGKNISRYEAPHMISSYLWAQYADLTCDSEANDAYEIWASLFSQTSGFALDAGCAVGRFTLELSRRADYSVGVDASLGFIKKARELMSNKAVRFTLPEEGMLRRAVEIRLPDYFTADNVEFVVADVERLPFPSSRFGAVGSLNIVDKVSRPLQHLQEIDRVSKESGAQFLFSDPFSWSAELTSPDNWLGGKEHGSFRGKGYENIVDLFSGKISGLKKSWRIEGKGRVWWKIRNHANHFELIRSLFFKAVSAGFG